MSKDLKSKPVGVVVGRFQVPKLHEGHLELLNFARKNSERLIIVIGIASVINTRKDPYDYKTREFLLKEYYPEATIVGLKDRSDDGIWSTSLDELVSTLVNPHENITMYGGRDSFIKHYAGKFPTKEMEASIYYSGSDVRDTLWNEHKSSVEYRAGVLSAAYSRYPTTYPTVDIAIYNKVTNQILLGAKTDDLKLNKWRLPGGFVDISDNSFISAARRELREEVGLIEVSELEYVFDTKVKDWRYDSQSDAKIHTIVFKGYYIYGTPIPGDDLVAVKWVNYNLELRNILVPGHVRLVENLINRCAF